VRGHHWSVRCPASTRLVTVLMPLALRAMACVCRSVMASSAAAQSARSLRCEATTGQCVVSLSKAGDRALMPLGTCSNGVCVQVWMASMATAQSAMVL